MAAEGIRRFAPFGNHFIADFDAQSFGGRLEGNYRFATAVGGVTAYADVVSGSFVLSYNARTVTDTRSELGASFDHVAAVGPGAALILRGRLASAHDRISIRRLRRYSRRCRSRGFVRGFVVNGGVSL